MILVKLIGFIIGMLFFEIESVYIRFELKNNNLSEMSFYFGMFGSTCLRDNLVVARSDTVPGG